MVESVASDFGQVTDTHISKGEPLGSMQMESVCEALSFVGLFKVCTALAVDNICGLS